MAFLIKAEGLPKPECEWVFAPPRRFRFDFAWPVVKVAFECEGGTWVAGAHTRGKHYASDTEKYSIAAAEGWLVIRGTTDQIKNGQAIGWLKRALDRRGAADVA